MVRRFLLAIVLVALGLALINDTAVALLPKNWVPQVLFTADRYIGGEGSVVGAVFGLGLILTAFSPIRYRLWVVVAILFGLINIAINADRYYQPFGRDVFSGRGGDVVPMLVFWVAATALLLALFPTRGRPTTAYARPQPLLPTGPPITGPPRPPGSFT
jgi:hypothetical protein